MVILHQLREIQSQAIWKQLGAERNGVGEEVLRPHSCGLHEDPETKHRREILLLQERLAVGLVKALLRTSLRKVRSFGQSPVLLHILSLIVDMWAFLSIYFIFL